MAIEGKDSRAIIKFRRLFLELREMMDHDPIGLIETAASDDGLYELCCNLWWVASDLSVAQSASEEQFALTVDPKFIVEWRLFEERWEEPLDEVFWGDLLGTLKVPAATIDKFKQTVNVAEERWKKADHFAQEDTANMHEVLKFAQEQADPDREFDEDYVEDIKNGVRTWRKLFSDVGLDLRGVLRRRRLTPFVLVPRHVAANYGDESRMSLITNLGAAQRAFVFGSLPAALALMRSILESALRDHYGAVGADLDQRISNAKRLPERANRGRLHSLRKRANAVLHLDDEVIYKLPVLDDEGLEKEIVSLLLVLRALIEEAPVRPL